MLQGDVPSSWFAGCFVNLGTNCYGLQCSWPGPRQAAIVSRVLCLFACSFVCLFVCFVLCLFVCLFVCLLAYLRVCCSLFLIDLASALFLNQFAPLGSFS